MKLKTVTVDGKTYAEVQDGKPVYATDDGKEIAFDATGVSDTIRRLNGEAKGHREAKEAAESALRAFEGITDAEAARKAMDTIKNIDDKKLVDAGKVEEIKAAAIAAVEAKYKPIVEERDKLQRDLHGEKIGGSFARSGFIKDKVAVPADMIQSQFGRNYKLEDGKVVAYDQSGNIIYSPSNPGKPAEFDEALEILVNAYPHKAQILKGTGNTGTGKPPGVGGQGIGNADTSKLSPVERINAARASGASR